MLRTLEPAQRPQLAQRADELAAVAVQQSADDFARRLRAEARQLRTDDGVDRYEQQRRATRLTTGREVETRMWRLSGVFDPLTGDKLQRVIDATVNRLFAEGTPATCPTDPMCKQDHLRALALVELITNGGATVTTPEAILVLQASPDGEVAIDLGSDIEVPRKVLDDLVRDAAMFPVVVRHGDVVWAPGQIELGRAQRLASPAQRRTLRALYRSCAVPGCSVPFQRVKIHHIVEYEHGGCTDLANLVPLCAHHHALVHAGNWHLHLGPGRVLTIDLPDGTRLRGPPNRAGP